MNRVAVWVVVMAGAVQSVCNSCAGFWRCLENKLHACFSNPFPCEPGALQAHSEEDCEMLPVCRSVILEEQLQALQDPNSGGEYPNSWKRCNLRLRKAALPAWSPLPRDADIPSRWLM